METCHLYRYLLTAIVLETVRSLFGMSRSCILGKSRGLGQVKIRASSSFFGN